MQKSPAKAGDFHWLRRPACLALATQGGGPFCDGCLVCLTLTKLCGEILLADGPAACAAKEAGATTPALERVVEANNLLSGLGFESGGLAVVHALHNGIAEIPGSYNYIHA